MLGPKTKPFLSLKHVQQINLINDICFVVLLFYLLVASNQTEIKDNS